MEPLCTGGQPDATTDGQRLTSWLKRWSTNDSWQGYDAALGVGSGAITTPPTFPTNFVAGAGPTSGTNALWLDLPPDEPTTGQLMAFAAPTVISGRRHAVGSWITPSGGGGGYSVLPAPPNVSSGWSWSNQLSGTAANNGATLWIEQAANTTNSWSFFGTNVPGSTPWSVQIYSKMIPQIQPGSSTEPCTVVNEFGLAVFDGTKMEDIDAICYQNAPNIGVQIQQWTSLTSTPANIVAANPSTLAPALTGIYYEVCDDGTNLREYYSLDGVNYIRLNSEAVGSFLGTITQVGFSILNEVGSNPAYGDVLGYQLSTTSVTCP